MLITILMIILLLAEIGAVPAWPYSTGWGYYPSGGAGTGSDCAGRFTFDGQDLIARFASLSQGVIFSYQRSIKAKARADF